MSLHLYYNKNKYCFSVNSQIIESVGSMGLFISWQWYFEWQTYPNVSVFKHNDAGFHCNCISKHTEHKQNVLYNTETQKNSILYSNAAALIYIDYCFMFWIHLYSLSCCEVQIYQLNKQHFLFCSETTQQCSFLTEFKHHHIFLFHQLNTFELITFWRH